MQPTALADAIAAVTGRRIKASTARQLAGGDSNAAWRFVDDAGAIFVKTNDRSRHDMFVAESAGLVELRAAGALRVPEPIATGVTNRHAFLALEYLDLERIDDYAAARLGAALARLHSHTADDFGWHRDNTIGLTPQSNTRDDNWPRFFAERRLGYQLDLARNAGATQLALAGARLCERIGVFFAAARFEPCLVHGDLWAGNCGVVAGIPAVFDPAVYYGDPETDIAMTELFGGFPQPFYAAYRHECPEREGARERRDLYRLYHVLNHFNLFGAGYGAQAEAMIARLLALT